MKKSIVFYITVFLAAAVVLCVGTSALCGKMIDGIRENYPVSGERYYLTNEEGERLGEGAVIGTDPVPLSERDERLILVLEVLPAAAVPVISAVCIMLAALFFYRNKLKEPILALRTASEKIAENDLDFRIAYQSGDELGQLCDSFEIMRRTLADNFSEMWRQMEERRRLNAAFAHDLRTPLTVLKGYDEMLRGSGDSTVRETAFTMEKHILRLERYVDSMSRISRLEDALPVSDDSSAEEHIAALIESAEILCRQHDKRLTVRREVSGDLPAVDWSFVSQVGENLISNAVRYAVSDISVVFAKKEKGFSLAVEDDGRGFSEEMLQRTWFSSRRSRRSG